MPGKTIYACVTNDLTYDQRMRRMAEAWSEGGYEVTMVGRVKPTSEILAWDGIRTDRLAVSAPSGPRMYITFNYQLYRYLRKARPDIIVAADVDTLLGAGMAARAVGAKLVFDAHEWFTEVPELLDAPMKRWLWGLVEQWGVKRVDLCYTVNTSLAEIFSEKHKKDFHIIRNIPILHNPPDRQGSKIILYQGALNAGRGLEPLIDAMSSLKDFELHLAGEGDLSAELRQKASQSPAGQRIHFLGYVRPDTLRKLTAKAFIGVNLLETESKNYYYSLANKFFDYMHAGVPSLNMAYPEYLNILKDHPCGQTIDRCDTTSISSTIRQMSEPDRYMDMVQAALEAREKYHWGREKEVLLGLFDQL